MADILAEKGVMNAEGKNGNLVVQELILPASHSKPEVVAEYEKFAKRIHWLDSNVIPGAFQMNTSWYLKPNTYLIDNPPVNGTNFLKSHKHDSNEIVAFYGINPDDPTDLGGEIIFYLDGEKHVLTKSTMMFIPAGMEHAPLIITRVDRPIFHFSVVMEDVYKLKNTDGDVYEAK